MSGIPEFEIVFDYTLDGDTEKSVYTFATANEVDAFLRGFQLGKQADFKPTSITMNTKVSKLVPLVGKPADKHEGYYKDECDCDYGTAHCPHIYKREKTR